MKKCPFCAEEIQDEAIKCRYCGSFLSTAPSPRGGEAGEPARPARSSATPAPERAGAAPFAREVARASDAPGPAHEPFSSDGGREFLYSGTPSWKAFLKEYFLIVALTIFVPILIGWAAKKWDASTFTILLCVAIPAALGVIAFAALHLYRKSKIVRVSTTNIETEMGILSKKIDVLELWRCRDVRYKQSLLDRVLGIAHIEIYTADVTSPQLEIFGLPASRQLFEKLRDSIEIQRQHRNVYGVIQ